MKKNKISKTQIIKIQVPIKKEIKELAEKRAEEIGFGSVQDAVRLFLAGFVRGEYYASFNSGDVKSTQRKESKTSEKVKKTRSKKENKIGFRYEA